MITKAYPSGIKSFQGRSRHPSKKLSKSSASNSPATKKTRSPRLTFIFTRATSNAHDLSSHSRVTTPSETFILERSYPIASRSSLVGVSRPKRVVMIIFMQRLYTKSKSSSSQKVLNYLVKYFFMFLPVLVRWTHENEHM